MRKQFVTIIIITIFSAFLKAQSEILPDTIIYQEKSLVTNRPINVRRDLFEYNNVKKPQHIVIEKWDNNLNRFVFDRDTFFSYLSDGRISKKTTPSVVISYDYDQNKNITEILYKDIVANNILEKYNYGYDSNNNQVNRKYFKFIGFTLLIQEDFYSTFDAENKRIEWRRNFFKNGSSSFQFIHEYTHYTNKIIETESVKLRNMMATDTSWQWSYKNEFIHKDQDNKLDVVQFYNFIINSGWVKTSNIGFFYNEKEIVHIHNYDKNPITSKTIFKLNEKGKVIESISENWNSSINGFSPRFYDKFNYRNDGAILYLKSYSSLSKDEVLLDTLAYSFASFYGYKSEPLSVDYLSEYVDIAIYPNPSSQVINIDCAECKIFEYKLISTSGQQYKEAKKLDSSNVIIERTIEPSGLYILQINTNKGVLNRCIILN